MAGSNQIKKDADICKLLEVVYINELAAEVLKDEYLLSIENNNIVIGETCVK